ncbi:MAG TPA: phosphatidate cytidylyltransferase [Candidatus Paenalcaligenes intestinipullorum]|uniref:Phosphatidate cytidylyltransferase n=1 Tax=Candidatus Paenalcaligenes intestinipullorum TaxID=2838718 RepID=A0A9D2U767_9BURK|nr:phosphatidate cytidylyltransferase [Candidatus Paenalcaligenes intestinipullorum]
MNTPQSMTSVIWLFVGIGAVLLLATLLGQRLERNATANNQAMLRNLNQRINAWWVMIVLIAIALIFGFWGVWLLFFIISFLALREFITLLPTRAADYWALIAAFYIILPLQYIWIGMHWYGLFSIFIPVYAFLILPILAVFEGDNRNFLERTSKVQWGLMISVFCISHVPALLTLELPGFEHRQILLMLFLILVVQSSDVLQYVWGKLVGKKLIAPKVSPSKTWAGTVGGILSASLLGALLWWITPFSFAQAFLMAFIINMMGFLGGLVMSAIKRDRGVKDWGHLIAGHGGMLDRLDSVCFAAPVFFHLTRYYWG